MDHTISHYDGDFLQRRLHASSHRTFQPIFNALSSEMAAHPSRNADGVSHGDAGMRRLWTRPIAGDNVCFGSRNVVRYTGE